MEAWLPLDTIFLSLMVHLEMIRALKSIHVVVCKPMIVGAFDMVAYLFMIPSSLGDGVLYDGIEVSCLNII